MARLRLFGHPALESSESSAPLGLPAKAVAVIALIATNAERPVSRDWLAQTVWPDTDPSDARANLRRQLHQTLKALGEDAFVLTRQSVQWNTSSGVECDVVKFDALRTTNGAAAVEQYAGELCAGISEECLESARLRYRSRYEHLLRTLIESAQRAGDDAQIRVYLQRLVAYDPFDEDAVREIMRSRFKSGDRAGAIREYNALSHRLTAELSVEPQPATRALFTEIIGENAALSVPNNLTTANSTFVGRERDLTDIAAALHKSRVVALTGPGGIGKSRLATRACFDLLSSYPGGVWFVDLENVKRESDIWQRISEAARIPPAESPEQTVLGSFANAHALIVLDTCEHVPQAAAAVIHKLSEATAVHVLATSRRRLSVDGMCELAVGPLDIPPVTLGSGDSALRYSAYRLLVERASLVNPAFHVERREMEPLTRLLQSVDGLPLAIELIASRANVLSISGMRKRLSEALRAAREHAGARNRTMDAALSWSYELLDRRQQKLFAALAVFRSAFTADDVERVCADVDQPVSVLFELLDASLVSALAVKPETRYRLLETTRSFAAEKLAPELARVAQAHAEHFARKADAIAVAADKDLSELLESTLQSMPDFLAALDYACEHEAANVGLQLLEGLHKYGIRNHYNEDILGAGLRLLESAKCAGAVRARISRIAGMLSEACGRYQDAIPLFDASVEYYRAVQDELRLCDALTGLAIMAYHLGCYDECERRFIEIRERTERTGDTMLLLKTLGRLGALYLSQGQFEKALPLLERAALGLPELGELRQSGTALKNVATAAHYLGRHDEAIEWVDRALANIAATGEVAMHAVALCMRAAAQRERGDVEGAVQSLATAAPLLPVLGKSSDLAECCEDAASTFAAIGRCEVAARLMGFSDALRTSIGSPMNPGLRTFYDRTCRLLERSLGGAFRAYHALGASDTAEAIFELFRTAVSPASEQEVGTPDSEDTTSLS